MVQSCAEEAARDDAAAGELLGRAGDLQEERPSYYGAAWTALARMMLDTDWLGNCG
jgi:endoglucanase